jgi:hypothetical protein
MGTVKNNKKGKTMRYVNVGLFRIGPDNQIITRNTKSLLSVGHDYRIIPDPTIPNSAGYPDIKTYLELEAQDDHVLVHMDQANIVTAEPSSATEAPNPILQGLEAYWMMSEASGTRVDSVSGVQLQELDGEITSVGGKLGDAAALTANNRLYIAGEDDNFLKPTNNPFSLAVWLYPTESLVRPVLGYRPYTVTNGGIGWYLQWNGSLDLFTFSYSTTAHGTPGINATTMNKTGGIEGGWNLVIITFDGTNISFYVNNQAPLTEAIFGGGSFYQSTADFVIGGYTDRNDGSYIWDGYVDSLGWWSRVLTADEINALWNDSNGIELF